MFFSPRASLRDIYQPARLEFMLAELEQKMGMGRAADQAEAYQAASSSR